MEKSQRLEEAAQAFRQAVVELSRFFFPLAAFLLVVAPDFIGALFGEKFLPAVPVFRVGVVSVMLAVLPVEGVLRARHETRHILISYAVKALVTLPLVYFGVKWFGLMGAIGSWAITEVVGKTMLMLRLRRALSPRGQVLDTRELLPGRDLLVTLGASVTMALALFSLLELAGPTWVHAPPKLLWRFGRLAVMGLLFGGGYLLALRLFGVRLSTLLVSSRGQRAAGAAQDSSGSSSAS
jgi:hypothetical protein